MYKKLVKTRAQIDRGHAVRSAASLTALFAGLSSFAALAQTPPTPMQATDVDNKIDEIVVTARRIAENIQETPIAITAFSGEALEQRGATDLEQAARFVPNVVIASSANGGGGSSNSQIAIRGVGQTDFIITTDPGVGVYIDGVYFARSTGGVIDLLNLERIEVLRGPQGTLFGRNTIGGAISLVSADPSSDFKGRGQLTLGSRNRVDASLLLDIPVTSTFGIATGIGYRKQNGFQRNLETGRDLSNDDSFTARAKAVWRSGDVKVSVAGDVTIDRENSAAAVLVAFDPARGGLAGLYEALVSGPAGFSSPVFISPKKDPVDRSTGPNISTLDSWGLSGTIEAGLGEATAKSITAYRNLKANFGNDQDNSPSNFAQTLNRVNQWQFSQELQFTGKAMDGRLSYLFGAYYFHERARDNSQIRLAGGLFNALEALPAPLIYLGGPAGTSCANFGVVPGVVCAGGRGNPVNVGFDLEFDSLNDVTTDSYAGFTNLSYEVVDGVRVSGGLRYTKEKKGFFTDQFRINARVPLIPPTRVEDEFSALTYRAGVDWKVNNNLFVYSSYSRGFKSGGFNGRPTTVAAVEAFGPEYLNSLEFGTKSDLFDNRLRVNAAAFFNRYDDIQLTAITADATGNLVLVTQNAGKADIKGFELEIQAKPVQGLDLNGALGYTDAKFTRLNPGAQVGLNSRFVNTPEWTLALGASYSIPVAALGSVTLRGDATYRSRSAQDVPNTPELFQPAYWLLNARLSLLSRSEKYELSGYARNLTNQVYITSGFSAIDSFGIVEAVLGRPREYGVTFTARF